MADGVSEAIDTINAHAEMGEVGVAEVFSVKSAEPISLLDGIDDQAPSRMRLLASIASIVNVMRHCLAIGQVTQKSTASHTPTSPAAAAGRSDRAGCRIGWGFFSH